MSTELIKVAYDSDRPTVLARDLHEFLEVETRFNDWFKRMCEYGFEEGRDFYSFLSKTPDGGRPSSDAQLTIEMAKEICMLQRNERGKQARQYFISLEAAWNSPEQVMARALRLADKKLEELTKANTTLTVQNQIMAPKADYFDELVDRNLLTGIRETAKQLHVPPKKFVDFLLERQYMYRDKKGKLMPYARYVEDGLFELKETYNTKTQWSGTQVLITPKGRETFRLLAITAA